MILVAENAWQMREGKMTCSKKHWKRIGKRSYNCTECDEVLTLGVGNA